MFAQLGQTTPSIKTNTCMINSQSDIDIPFQTGHWRWMHAKRLKMLMNRIPTRNMDLFLLSCEPNQKQIESDLKQLAKYLVKIGSDTSLVKNELKRHRLRKHSNLSADVIEKIVDKYGLFFDYNQIRRTSYHHIERSLHHIAHNYPEYFIEAAAELTPGCYDERRFWWCASNYPFYLKYRHPRADSQSGESPCLRETSPNRLLSDVLCQILTIDDFKLMTISALHLSVKHSEGQVFRDWFDRNFSWICKQAGKTGVLNDKAETKALLRARYKIEEAEEELNYVDVDAFINGWNFTGLRK